MGEGKRREKERERREKRKGGRKEEKTEEGTSFGAPYGLPRGCLTVFCRRALSKWQAPHGVAEPLGEIE